jgi:tRNA dimethylallyltransferase
MGDIIVIVGPTAVGKSELAVTLAQRLQGEVVSADSVQVYRYLDIGSAKPSLQERISVPHHLLDSVDPDQDYTVADFQHDAQAAIAKIHKRERMPILVGGSGLYIRAVIRNYSFSSAGQNLAIRARLIKEAEQFGGQHLYEKLCAADPRTACKVHPHDLRRIIRALEACEQNTRPLSDQVEETRDAGLLYRVFMYGLTMPRELLYQRIEKRVDMMIENGFVEEVRGLLARGFSQGSKALTSLGYRHIISHINGEITLEQAAELIKRDTRRFAKRQLTWFRRDTEITWFDVSTDAGIAGVAENICNLLAGYYQLEENK